MRPRGRAARKQRAVDGMPHGRRVQAQREDVYPLEARRLRGRVLHKVVKAHCRVALVQHRARHALGQRPLLGALFLDVVQPLGVGPTSGVSRAAATAAAAAAVAVLELVGDRTLAAGAQLRRRLLAHQPE